METGERERERERREDRTHNDRLVQSDEEDGKQLQESQGGESKGKGGAEGRTKTKQSAHHSSLRSRRGKDESAPSSPPELIRLLIFGSEIEFSPSH